MEDPASTPRRRFLAPLPTTGVWTSLGLGRGQFLSIIAASCLLFLLWGGPLWQHLGERDFPRLATSYALIPLLVFAAQRWNGPVRWSLFAAASGVIAVLKLLLTAALDLVIGLAGSGAMHTPR